MALMFAELPVDITAISSDGDQSFLKVWGTWKPTVQSPCRLLSIHCPQLKHFGTDCFTSSAQSCISGDEQARGQDVGSLAQATNDQERLETLLKSPRIHSETSEASPAAIEDEALQKISGGLDFGSP